MNKIANDFAAAGSGLIVTEASTGKNLAFEPRNPAERFPMRRIAHSPRR